MLARGWHHVLQRPLVSSFHSFSIPYPPPHLKDRKVKLPKTPPAPTGLPVYVTETEYIKHVRPLHWYRWSIRYLRRDLFLRDGELSSGFFISPYLKRDLFFCGFENAKRFMDRLNRIFRADKHEPFLSVHKVDFGVEDAYKITIFLSTRQCHDAPSVLDRNGTRIGPGISVYDARFAIVVEKSFQRFLWTKRAFDLPWRHQVIMDNVEGIKARQRDKDLELIQKELKRVTPVKTPSPANVTPFFVPEPPPWVSDEPCTDEDFEDVIQPLYARGWYLVYNNVTPEVDGKFVIEKRPVLNGFFRFTSFEAALRFSQDVVDLASAEKITVSLWLDARTVTVQGVSQVLENRVMRRDARFAVLVEQLFADKYTRQTQRSQVQGMKLLLQPGTVKEVATHPAVKFMPMFMKAKWERIRRKRQMEMDRVRRRV